MRNYKKEISVALVDNNDSFTYNVVELVRRVSGSSPIVINTENIQTKELDSFDKIILSPGPGLPDDFPVLKEIIQAHGKQKPILGICLGHQSIAEFFGAKLYNLKKVLHGQSRQIQQIAASNLFENMPEKFNAGLYHSWAVDQTAFPDELKITSISSDNLIMSLEHQTFPVYGVQFHPESYITEHAEVLMYNFLKL